MKTICLLFAFTLLSYSSAIAQSLGPNFPTHQRIAYPVVPQYYMYAAPPPVIYQPQYQIQYKPLEYRGSTYNPKFYRTPLRNWLFGRGTINHYYYPQNEQ